MVVDFVCLCGLWNNGIRLRESRRSRSCGGRFIEVVAHSQSWWTHKIDSVCAFCGFRTERKIE